MSDHVNWNQQEVCFDVLGHLTDQAKNLASSLCKNGLEFFALECLHVILKDWLQIFFFQHIVDNIYQQPAEVLHRLSLHALKESCEYVAWTLAFELICGLKQRNKEVDGLWIVRVFKCVLVYSVDKLTRGWILIPGMLQLWKFGLNKLAYEFREDLVPM